MRVKTHVTTPKESSYRALHDAVTNLESLEASPALSKELDKMAFKGPLQFKFFLQNN